MTGQVEQNSNTMRLQAEQIARLKADVDVLRAALEGKVPGAAAPKQR